MLDHLKRLFPRLVKQVGPLEGYNHCVDAFELRLLFEEFNGNVLDLEDYRLTDAYKKRLKECEAECAKQFGGSTT